MTPPPPTETSGPHSIQLGSGAAPLRRSLGSQAWCALECLAARSTVGPDGVTAVASVRAVAVELGVAKNTAHRAIATLVSAGVVAAEQQRHDDGTFSAGRYRLHLVDAIVVSVSEPEPITGRPDVTRTPPNLPLSAPPRPRARASRPTPPADQLSLLDA